MFQVEIVFHQTHSLGFSTHLPKGKTTAAITVRFFCQIAYEFGLLATISVRYLSRVFVISFLSAIIYPLFIV